MLMAYLTHHHMNGNGSKHMYICIICIYEYICMLNDCAAVRYEFVVQVFFLLFRQVYEFAYDY